MALKIETFSNVTGGNSYFKAISHPLAAGPGRALVDRLTADGPIAIYDPYGMVEPFAELYGLGDVAIEGIYVQAIDKIGRALFGRAAKPVTALAESPARLLFVAAFDESRVLAAIRHLLPAGMEVVGLDALRLPDEMLTDRRTYLASLNFATNFAFFRDEDGHHTRLVTANYWGSYGATEPKLWCCLFDGAGQELKRWTEPLPPAGGSVVVDSQQVRRRFGLGPFTGQLFVHVLGAAGHDVVKYALDTYGDDPSVLSCTHDANAWPADRYAGLPAPADGETVILWVQNSHPCPIPAGAIGLTPMGSERVARLDREIAPFASYPLDVAALLPGLAWPGQIEIHAGKHMVRPRYEVVAGSGRRRMAHPNVERADLKPDPRIPDLGTLLGKGYILPAPVLPTDRYSSALLPTPMATGQRNLPIAAVVYDREGSERARHRFGVLGRDHKSALELDTLLGDTGLDGAALDGGYGHVELVYDFAEGGEADGWLHALFRYRDRASGHAAETSFGAHVFNTALTYRDEPQSYTGRPPGLSTRLFLRLGPVPLDTICQLVYPASLPWHPRSQTALILTDCTGVEVARHEVQIACGGSFLFHASALFDTRARARAGDDAYILVRDTTCRLFGYHGLTSEAGAFSLDHMFGF